MRRALLASTLALLAIVVAHAQGNTATPIKPLIVIFGENRSFDHVFGTFEPPLGQTVANLLSLGIMNADGSPGPNFPSARQWQAANQTVYSVHPAKTTIYSELPAIAMANTPSRAPFQN